MKVGKESIAGVMAALEAWERRDHAGIRGARERRSSCGAARCGIAGVAADISPTPPPTRSSG